MYINLWILYILHTKNNIYMHTVPVNPKFYEFLDQLNKKVANTTVELLGNEDPSFYFKTQAFSY